MSLVFVILNGQTLFIGASIAAKLGLKQGQRISSAQLRALVKLQRAEDVAELHGTDDQSLTE